jgi:hypothetical protein
MLRFVAQAEADERARKMGAEPGSSADVGEEIAAAGTKGRGR